MNSRLSTLEILESRIAPASVFTYTDIDGDKVTIKSTSGNLAGDETIVGGQLQELNLSDPSFNHASISFTVVRAGDGDGLAAVGFIDGGANDFGSITIKGDLGAIDCGSSTSGTPAIKSLTVRSLGRYGLLTQGASGTLESKIDGAIGALNVAGDVDGVQIQLSGGITSNIGSITVGGSWLGGATAFTGYLLCPGNIGPVKIGGDLQGGSGEFAGGIAANGNIASLAIGGSLVGGSGTGISEGIVFAEGNIGPVVIGHNLQGGSSTGAGAGVIGTDGTLESVTIGGSMIGGSSINSADLGASLGVGPVKIGHNLIGGSATNAAYIQTQGNFGGLTVGGSVIGGSGMNSASFFAQNCGPVKIGGDLLGGSGPNSGDLQVGGILASASVGGSILGGANTHTGAIEVTGSSGPITVGGDIQGGSDSMTGLISSGGPLGAVTIRGSLLGSSSSNTGEILSSGSIGLITIGHDLRGGSTNAGLISDSGYIQGEHLTGVIIGGSIGAGFNSATVAGSLVGDASIAAGQDLGFLTVKGRISGSVSASENITTVTISGLGQATPTVTIDRAIGAITVGGRVENTLILAGYDLGLNPANGGAQIGAVTVGGDWIASSLVAGIEEANNAPGFGGPDDFTIGGPPTIARIASITIKGVVEGSTAAGNQFGFESDAIGPVRIDSFPVTVPTAPGTIDLSPLTGDVTLRVIK